MTDDPLAEDEWPAEDLDDAIESARHALAEAPGHEAVHVGGELGLLLYGRFRMRSERTPAQPGGDAGAENDLESAIALLTQAASASGSVDPDITAGLGRALADRFERSGNESDRSQAIIWLRLRCDTTGQAGCDPEDCLMLAALLADQAEEQGDCADATAAIGHAQHAVDGLDGDIRAFAQYVLGAGYLVRAGIGQTRDDLPAAIGHLRESASLLPDGHPGRLAVETRLGLALAQWASGDPDAPSAEALDDAVRLLSRARQGLPADDPVRPRVRYALAMALTLRFSCYAGSESDAQTALSELEAILGQPGLDTAIADACHLLVAFVLIYRSTPESLRQRSAGIDPGQAGRMLARGSGRPSPDTARAALEHLDQISDLAAVETQYAHLVPSLRGIASLSLDDGELAEGAVGPWVEMMEEGLRLTPGDDPEAGLLHGMTGLLRAAKAAREPGGHDFGAAVGSLVTAARQLGDKHPMLPLLNSILGGAFGIPLGGRQPTAEESEAAITLLEAVLDEVPDDHPDRANVLIRLGLVLIGRALHPDGSMPRLQKLRRQLDAVVARPAASQLNDAANHALLGLVEGVEGMLAPDGNLVRAAVERLRRAAGLASPNPALSRLIQACVMAMCGYLYFQKGELQYLDAATYYGREMVRMAGGDTADDPLLLSVQTLLAAGPAARHPDQVDEARLREMAAQLEATRNRMPEDHPLRQTVTGDLNMLRIVRGSLARLGAEAGTEPPDQKLIGEAADAAVALAQATAGDDPFYAMNLGTAGNARAMQGILIRDRRVANDGIAMLAEACAASIIPDHRRRLLSMLAMVLRMRYDFTHDRNDLSGMISRLEEARSLADEESGSLVAEISFMCALGRYERGDRNLQDRRRAVALGLDALREHSATVLLQSTTDRAFDAAVDAAGEAASVVRWCLADGSVEAAVEALERGRGMVLHAAIADASVASALREAGHGGLAVEWERALAAAETAGPDPWDLLPGPAASLRGSAEAAGAALAPEFRVPSDLRHRVVTALAGTGLERLLAPPPVTEIAQALNTAGARALVYLLPQEGTAAGLALAVDDAGGVREVRLPRLALVPRGPAAAFAQAQQDLRGAGPTTADEVRSRWRRALEDLCDWAWTAAMEQVLGSLAGRPGRPVRLVLVPVGELGLVPWHAARRAVADGRLRYACQDAVLSYAASARQFTDACRNGHRPWDSEAALVRVPESRLYFASKEVQEIHRRYYPAGILLGGDDDLALPASPGNVRDLLPRPRAGGASLLHLGCHAEPASRPVDGRLLLEGGEALGMRDILQQARDRPRDTSGCLVVLAACGSDLTDGHHDEALTLATSFLAAGAAGTVGARWPVDDLPTLAFMTMFHHYLNSGYDDPSIALRNTQAWMLNPGRTFPEAFRPKIAELVRTIDLAKTEFWAAFTYQGQ
jgi:tetratricopeptide (TPR) repeat protein